MQGKVVIKTELDTKSFEGQIKQVEYELKQVEFELSKQKELKLNSRDIADYTAKAEKLRNRLIELKKKQDQVNSNGFANVQSSIENVGKSLDKTIKKVSKWALAVFGVRSAYMAVRRAASTLSEYNEELKNSLNGIQLVLASALEPLITRLVNLAWKLLSYVNYIAKAWFGVDIFASASAKSIASGAKSAKDMKKSLAGFDEINMVSDSTSQGSSGGGSSVTIPTMEEGKVPEWIKWIAENKDIIISTLFGIAAGLLAIKFGADLLMGLGIGIIIAGIIGLIKSIIEYLKDSSWNNFGNILIWIGVILAGVALAFAALPVALVAAIVLIVGILIKYWDKIKSFLINIKNWVFEKTNDLMNKIADKLGWLSVPINGLVGIISGTVGGIIDFVVDLLDGLFTGLKQWFDGIIKIFKGDFKNGIIGVAKGIANIIIGIINGLIAGLNTVISPIRALIVAVGKVLGKKYTMDNIKIPKIPLLAKGGIINQPGRGVMVGSAIAGERGQEGVIPLTDSQQMALLGEAIGKYITINATINTQMNGRTISRELKQIQNSQNFAMNR